MPDIIRRNCVIGRTIVGLLCWSITMALAFTAVGIAMPSDRSNDHDVDAQAVENEVLIQPLWVDSAVRHESREHLVKELWSLQLGVLVIHTDETLSRSLSMFIATRLAWFPRDSIELRRLAAPAAERLHAAPDIRDRYTVPMDRRPSPLRYQQTIELPDGRYATMGITTISMANPLPDGLYQIRLNPKGFSMRADTVVRVKDNWHIFYLRDVEDEPKDHIEERIPWFDREQEASG